MSAHAIQTACDRGIAHAIPQSPSHSVPTAHPRLVLAMTILASSLAFIDGSVVNVGLPAIGRSLSAGGAGLSWVINGYLLPLSALLLIGGAAGDVFGRARLLITGVVLFALASMLCAVAPDLNWLIAGRVLQGVGAALLMPNSLAILGAAFDGEARGRAIGTWAAVGAGAGAVGPLLGGYLIDFVGWRAIFLINLPIAAGAVALAARFARDDRVGGGADHRRLDLGGAALAAAALTALTWGLTVASAAEGFGRGASATLFVGALMLAAFVWLERTRGDAAMMPLTLFASRSFVGLTLLTLLLYGALGGLLVLVPYVLIEANSYSATMAGAALLPLPIVIALTASRMGQLAGRIGARLPLSIGPIVVAAGCVLAIRIAEPGGYWTNTLPAILVISLGMAGAVAPLTTAVLSSVEPQHTGVASGFNSAVARTGGLIATAFVSAVLAAHGAPMLALFRIAALVGAGAAVAAGICAWVGLAPVPGPRAERPRE
jgi:EmrB/QacA subfamily drug resistance transporter